MLSSSAQRFLASSRALLTLAMKNPSLAMTWTSSSLFSRKRKASSVAAASSKEAKMEINSSISTSTTAAAAAAARAPPPPSRKKQKSSAPSSSKKKIKTEAEAAVPPPPSSPPSSPLLPAARAGTAATTKKKKASSVLPPSPNASASNAAVVASKKADRIFAQLAELYPDPPCPLDHANRTQLLVAVMLSAQTTDIKVNECTKTLFKEAPTAAALAELGAAGIERHIRSLGLAPTKAKNVAATARILVERYGGGNINGEGKGNGKEGNKGKELLSNSDLPVAVTREELESLPGVGRKTASVVLAMSGVEPALPVDTHIDRLSKRWGLSRTSASVLQVESDLRAAFARHEGEWHRLHLRLIYFGREHCPAQRHVRASCPICSWAGV